MSNLPFETIQRTILVRKEAATSEKFGCAPDKRPIEQLLQTGIVNIDKPQGPTSHQVSAYVKQILHLTKAGHSGTLDPNVSGVLPVALGRSTKIVQALLPSGKEYVCIMHIHHDVPEEKIRKTIAQFVGNIMQLPPLKSAVKREVRERTIYYIDIIEIEGNDVLFRVGCQAGTYIRKLCTDLGKQLGVGAHMAELRRSKVGPFTEATLVSLQELQDAYVVWQEEKTEQLLRKCIQPIEQSILHLPKVWVSDYTVNSLCHGAALNVPGIAQLENTVETGKTVAILTLKNELIALGTAKMSSDDIMKKDKGVVALIDAVFIDPGVYPKLTRK
jgi:H/ACA ribonucleoprotein complex subunit 4